MTKSPHTRDSIVLFIVLFVLIVATLSTLAFFFTKDRMQQDINEKIQARLDIKANEAYQHLDFALVGLDLTVRGRIADEQQRQQVLNQLATIDGLRIIHNEITLDPSLIKTAEKTLIKAEQLTGYFSLLFDAGKWQIAGDIDNEQTLTELIQTIHTQLSETINNQLQLNAVTEQPQWVTRLLDYLEQFSLLQGNIELSLKDGLLFISGDVNSPIEQRMILLGLREQFGENAKIQAALRILSFNEAGFYKPKSHPLIQSLDLSGIQFKMVEVDNKRRLTLTSSSADTLQALLTVLQDNPSLVIEISGHTNNIGQQETNSQKDQRLSLAKALIIKQWLVKQGIEKTRLKTSGYGAQRLLTDNPESAQQTNERVEITIIKGG
ncbi:MAG: OmpA family protein [bacterium]